MCFTPNRIGLLTLLLAATTACASASSDGAPISTPSVSEVKTGASSTDNAMPDASAIVSAFTAAELPAPNPRDNTARNCPDLQCTQLITTDAISVYIFGDEEAATHFVEIFGSEAHRDGVIVLSYAAARTPAVDRPKYERVLGALL